MCRHRHRSITPNLHRMATITRIKNKKGVKWRAQVFVKGKRDSARFDTKPAASEWAYEREAELRKGADLVSGKMVADALRRYADEIPKEKKGRQWDLVRLKKFERDPIAKIPASTLTLEHGEEFVERALGSGLAANTVIREMGLLKPVIRRMVRWKWISEYPWQQLEMPPSGKRRSKLFSDAEIKSIKRHCNLDIDEITTVTQEVGIAFVVATESGMRLNEICNIQSDWWDRVNRFVALPDWVTKTNTARNVPLSTVASDALGRLQARHDGRLFSVRSQSASTMFRRIRRRAGVHDGTFHDSRHYAVTKLSKKLDVLSLARVIGHSDIRELMTYYEADAAELAKKLD